MSTNSLHSMLNSFSKLSQTQMPKGNGMTFGTIKSLQPLSIRVDNHNFDLPEEFFYLGQMCRSFKVTMPHKHEYNGTATQNAQPPARALETIEQITQNVHEKLRLNSRYGYKQDYVEIEIIPKLKVGDRVLLFAFNNGQKYYVAERIEKDDMWDFLEGLHDGEPNDED